MSQAEPDEKINEAMQLLDEALSQAEYLPADTTPKLAKAWRKLQAARQTIQQAKGSNTMKAEVKVGQRWKSDDGYLMDVVAFSSRGWPVVRHPNAKRGGIETNPAWFGHWTRLR